jgi:parallel beta-helix repeat protein
MSRSWKCVTLILGAVCSAVQAGQLEPPGPVASTMRTAIRAADLPMTILAPGLYILEEDIVTAGGGITVEAHNVTIDLRGHSLRDGTGNGISAAAGILNVSVQNGTVSGWSGHGVDLSQSANSQVVGLRSEGNTGDGIRLGVGSLLTDCNVRNNTGDGIDVVGTGTVIARCVSTANGNSGMNLSVGPSSISHCTFFGNGGPGIGGGAGAVTVIDSTARGNAGIGIQLGVGSVVSRCSAFGNGDAANEDGIFVGLSSNVTDCSASNNAEDGIQVSSDSFVARNQADSNGTVDGAGIHVTGSGNRLEGNSVTDNDRGIDVDATQNLVIRNSASGNTTEYAIAGGNTVGPIVTSATIGASDNPHANYEH